MRGTTPMFVQYYDIKKDYPDCILFYRMGDFYEMFGEDAKKASQILGIALTARDGGKDIKVPMAGVPFHAAETYLGKLVAAGERVAICEQLQDPKEAKGIVERGVIRVVTPGVLIDEGILDENANYIAAIVRGKKNYGLAIADVSTGDFMAGEVQGQVGLLDTLDRFQPQEIILSLEDTDTAYDLQDIFSGLISRHLDFAFEEKNAYRILLNHFKVNDLAIFDYDRQAYRLALCAAGGLMDYLGTTLKQDPSHIRSLRFMRPGSQMTLDRATRKNLELIEAIGGQDKRFSLYGVLNDTVTAAGGRMLKDWINAPLRDPDEIVQRLDATESLTHHNNVRENLRSLLKDVYDIERIVSRIAYGTANAKDLVSLNKSLVNLPDLIPLISPLQCTLMERVRTTFDPMEDVASLLSRALQEQAPFSLREGGLIKEGYSEEVDRLRQAKSQGAQWIEDFEERERTRTGIKNLKVNQNKVFGYYIDVTKSQLDKVPEDYERKQTLVNNERFITPELKDMESQILGAHDRLHALEYALFHEIRQGLKEHIERFLTLGKQLALLDVLQSFAQSALKHGYVKPRLISEGYRISDLRHPVVEQALDGKLYVPNDVAFKEKDQEFLIITGPNMSGKSTYCRSVALASIMMQIGSFVPAREASMQVVDRVFARIGASDQLAHGQSTFMVEMNEVAHILHNASKNSLVILDEVGRGTSTYDGVSIAYAICLYMSKQIRAKTLFATHYHELTSLADEPGIVNYSVAVDDDGKEVVFLHKIVPGPASKSYGIHVAQLAGLPRSIIRIAEETLASLEEGEGPVAMSQGALFPYDFQANLTLEREYAALQDILNPLMDKDLTQLSIGEGITILLDLQKDLHALRKD